MSSALAAQLDADGKPEDARKLTAATTHWLRHYVPFPTMSCYTAMVRCFGLLLEAG